MDIFSKRSTIKQNLEKLIVDIPAYISTIENLSDRLDDKLGWKQFKFCFKLATSQIVSNCFIYFIYLNLKYTYTLNNYH